MRKLFVYLFLSIFFLGLVYGFTESQFDFDYPTNYSVIDVNNSNCWDGNCDENSKLDKDGGNADETIDINGENFVAGHLIPNANDTYDIGTLSLGNWNDLYLSGKLIDNGNQITIANIVLTYNRMLTWLANHSAYNSTWSSTTNSSYAVLNDNVTFHEIYGNGTLYLNNSIRVNAVNEINVGSVGIMSIVGKWVGTGTLALMNFNPSIQNSNVIGFDIKPTINYNKSDTGIRYDSSYVSGVNRDSTAFQFELPPHTDGFNSTFEGIKEGSNARSFVNVKGNVDWRSIILGNDIDLYDFGNEVTFFENMITLRGGVGNTIGTIDNNPTQVGINFSKFEDGANGFQIEMIHSSGGIINVSSDDFQFYIGEDSDVNLSYDDSDFLVNLSNDGDLRVVGGINVSAQNITNVDYFCFDAGCSNYLRYNGTCIVTSNDAEGSCI